MQVKRRSSVTSLSSAVVLAKCSSGLISSRSRHYHEGCAGQTPQESPRGLAPLVREEDLFRSQDLRPSREGSRAEYLVLVSQDWKRGWLVLVMWRSRKSEAVPCSLRSLTPAIAREDRLYHLPDPHLAQKEGS